MEKKIVQVICSKSASVVLMVLLERLRALGAKNLSRTVIVEDGDINEDGKNTVINWGEKKKDHILRIEKIDFFSRMVDNKDGVEEVIEAPEEEEKPAVTNPVKEEKDNKEETPKEEIKATVKVEKVTVVEKPAVEKKEETPKKEEQPAVVEEPVKEEKPKEEVKEIKPEEEEPAVEAPKEEAKEVKPEVEPKVEETKE